MPNSSIDQLIAKLNIYLPEIPGPPDFVRQTACRWVRQQTLLGHISYLESIVGEKDTRTHHERDALSIRVATALSFSQN